MASAFFTNKNNFLTCSFCFCLYDENEKKPKFLPCSHTFCLQCLQQGVTDGAYTCSVCNRTCSPEGGEVANLPDNTYALHMLRVDIGDYEPQAKKTCTSREMVTLEETPSAGHSVTGSTDPMPDRQPCPLLQLRDKFTSMMNLGQVKLAQSNDRRHVLQQRLTTLLESVGALRSDIESMDEENRIEMEVTTALLESKIRPKSRHQPNSIHRDPIMREIISLLGNQFEEGDSLETMQEKMNKWLLYCEKRYRTADALVQAFDFAKNIRVSIKLFDSNRSFVPLVPEESQLLEEGFQRNRWLVAPATKESQGYMDLLTHVLFAEIEKVVNLKVSDNQLSDPQHSPTPVCENTTSSLACGEVDAQISKRISHPDVVSMSTPKKIKRPDIETLQQTDRAEEFVVVLRNDDTIATLEEQRAAEIGALKDEWRQEVERLQRAHAGEKGALMERHQREIEFAKSKCAVCKNQSNLHCCGTVTYCTSRCQAAHWKEHKDRCNRRQIKKEERGADGDPTVSYKPAGQPDNVFNRIGCREQPDESTPVPGSAVNCQQSTSSRSILCRLGLDRTKPRHGPSPRFTLGQSVFIFRAVQRGNVHLDEVHIQPSSSVMYPTFVQKLGDFCFRSPKAFYQQFTYKAVPKMYISLPLYNDCFRPTVPEMLPPDTSPLPGRKVSEYGDVGFNVNFDPDVRSNRALGWNLIFPLENYFQSNHGPRLGAMQASFLFGRILSGMSIMAHLSLTSITEREGYTLTFESK